MRAICRYAFEYVHRNLINPLPFGRRVLTLQQDDTQRSPLSGINFNSFGSYIPIHDNCLTILLTIMLFSKFNPCLVHCKPVVDLGEKRDGQTIIM